jgi:hypothetical protein
MPTHNPNEPEREPVDASKGYEHSDVGVAGIAVFLTALTVFVVVTGLLAYGIGKVINAHLAKEDGAKSKWAKTVDVRLLGNLPSSPELENKMAELTQQLPAPKLQTDDGLQDTADLHAKEDLLLEYYSWGDQDSDRARDGVDRPAGIAGGAAGGRCAVANRGTKAHCGRAADQRLCAHRLRAGRGAGAGRCGQACGEAQVEGAER